MKKQQVIDLLKNLGFVHKTGADQPLLFTYSFGRRDGDKINVVFDEGDEQVEIYAFDGQVVDWQLKINVSGGFPYDLLATILTKAIYGDED